MSLSSDNVALTMPVQPANGNGSNGGFGWGGDWEADMRGTYARGSSHRGRKRDSMGRYSRDGRYSRHASPDMMDKLQTMMDNASTERERDAIRRLMNEMEME